MSLLLTMLPLYLFGNLHCLGMCGPLVMMIGHHRYRLFYFLGRLLSFSLAGLVAGWLGEVVDLVFHQYFLAEAAAYLFGSVLILLGFYTLTGRSYPGHAGLSRLLAPLNHTLSLFMLKDRIIPTFLFGFFTLLLPCGQTLIVFSACALYGSPSVGLLNGFVFALLTSPALFLAMQAYRYIQAVRPYYNQVIGISAIFVGILSFLRGLAAQDLIPHFVLSSQYHIVLY